MLDLLFWAMFVVPIGGGAYLVIRYNWPKLSSAKILAIIVGGMVVYLGLGIWAWGSR